MKYSCNACGKYVEAGGGHSCHTSYTPQVSKADAEVERLNLWIRNITDAFDLLAKEGFVDFAYRANLIVRKTEPK